MDYYSVISSVFFDSMDLITLTSQNKNGGFNVGTFVNFVWVIDHWGKFFEQSYLSKESR